MTFRSAEEWDPVVYVLEQVRAVRRGDEVQPCALPGIKGCGECEACCSWADAQYENDLDRGGW